MSAALMKAPVLDAAADLPAPVSAALTAFVSTASNALGSDLRAIVLFGSGAENRLRPTSDVNLIVVLSRFSPDSVRALSATLQAAHAAVRLNTMWLLGSEIPQALEAFAVKFADIHRRHRVLWGTDPFETISIPRHTAIARLRQVLLNLILRLRAGYALHGSQEERLARLVAEAAGPLRASAAEILELEGSAALAPREALQTIASSLPGGDWNDVLSAISEARETRLMAPGTAGPRLVKIIDLAGHLLGRTGALDRP